jgi:hypothetical protein
MPLNGQHDKNIIHGYGVWQHEDHDPLMRTALEVELGEKEA